jgi:hypothetical protein
MQAIGGQFEDPSETIQSLNSASAEVCRNVQERWQTSARRYRIVEILGLFLVVCVGDSISLRVSIVYVGFCFMHIPFFLFTLALIIASYEEEVLRAKYGEEYSSYKGKTGKWLPAIRKHTGPSRDQK